MDECNAKINKLKKALKEAELYSEKMWQRGERWVEQCGLPQPRLDLLLGSLGLVFYSRKVYYNTIIYIPPLGGGNGWMAVDELR